MNSNDSLIEKLNACIDEYDELTFYVQERIIDIVRQHVREPDVTEKIRKLVPINMVGFGDMLFQSEVYAAMGEPVLSAEANGAEGFDAPSPANIDTNSQVPIHSEKDVNKPSEISYNEEQFIHELAGWLHGRFSGEQRNYQELDSRQRKEWRKDAKIILAVYAKRLLHTTEPMSATSLFKSGTFTSHSGVHLPDKIDCDALTKADWDTLAAWVAQRVDFKAVIGIPRGGLAFAAALQPYCKPKGCTLIVDDVLTTGASMEETRKIVKGLSCGVVVFARGQLPNWVIARFTENNDLQKAMEPVTSTHE